MSKPMHKRTSILLYNIKYTLFHLMKYVSKIRLLIAGACHALLVPPLRLYFKTRNTVMLKSKKVISIIQLLTYVEVDMECY